MKGIDRPRFFRNATTLTTLSLLLSGCLMGEEESRSGDNIAADHRLSGSVGDGPIVGAELRIFRNDGSEIAQFQSDSNSSYNITVRAEARYYPLTIESSNGTDLVTNTAPDFDLLSAVFEQDNQSVANVNPFSTFAVELARDLPGGISMSNLQSAQGTVARELNNGLSTLVASGTMTTSIDGGNVAEIVRASEALGETVRRTRDAMNTSGSSTTANDVVRALSSDLTDGVIDGRGGPRTDARLAAVWTVASAQVLLETMANELHVNGVDATQAMSDAIGQVSTQTASPALTELTVTADMLLHARVGLVAAHTVTSDSAIEELLTALGGVQTGSGSSTVSMFALPADYRSRLNNAILLVAGGSTAVLDSVNDTSRDRTQTIGPDNQAPVISGTPSTSIEVGSAYSFAPTASDADGDTLSFTINNMPTWASFDGATGELSGTPAMGDIGSYTNIVVSVSDGALVSSLASFSIDVFSGNTAPQISGTPSPDVTVGQSYDFTPTASDPNGDSLTFSVAGEPSWLSFDNSTGRLSGTPSGSDVGVHGAISITVFDGSLSATLGPFSIEVIAVNAAPTISGSPTTDVTARQSYSFTPTANDPNGDTLVFSVVGLPGWASFDTSTGQISGTPGDQHVGTYTGITITVSDGAASASLAPFTITVQAVSLGSVTLTWTAPTQNEDGTALTDLDGYKIYWGTTPGSYPNSVTIDNESVTTYVVDNLAPGTYEFVATAFKTSGVESTFSNTATKTVP